MGLQAYLEHRRYRELGWRQTGERGPGLAGGEWHQELARPGERRRVHRWQGRSHRGCCRGGGEVAGQVVSCWPRKEAFAMHREGWLGLRLGLKASLPGSTRGQAGYGARQETEGRGRASRLKDGGGGVGWGD